MRQRERNSIVPLICLTTSRATCRGLAGSTHHWTRCPAVVIADLNREAAERVATGIRSVGHAAAATQTNVADVSWVQALVNFTVETYDGLDVAVNSAGLSSGANADSKPVDRAELVIEVQEHSREAPTTWTR
jgi:NAD(P)-dependent dehydrogenase (short-subunit alcohol dehydrogenase family)